MLEKKRVFLQSERKITVIVSTDVEIAKVYCRKFVLAGNCPCCSCTQ
jgi:hypothetical protein